MPLQSLKVCLEIVHTFSMLLLREIGIKWFSCCSRDSHMLVSSAGLNTFHAHFPHFNCLAESDKEDQSLMSGADDGTVVMSQPLQVHTTLSPLDTFPFAVGREVTVAWHQSAGVGWRRFLWRTKVID